MTGCLEEETKLHLRHAPGANWTTNIRFFPTCFAPVHPAKSATKKWLRPREFISGRRSGRMVRWQL